MQFCLESEEAFIVIAQEYNEIVAALEWCHSKSKYIQIVKIAIKIK